MSNNYNYHYLFKYILVGDSNVGKSSLLLKFIDQKYTDNYQPTLGVEFGSKNFKVQNLTVRAMIWDTAGQETFKSIIRTYYKGAIIAILVFDATNLLSFENLIKWIEEIKGNSHEFIKIIVAANKVDLADKRQVKYEDAKQFARGYGYQYIQISAKTGYHVFQVFANPADQLIQALINKKIVLTPHLNIGIKVGCPQSYQLQHQYQSVSPDLRRKKIKDDSEGCKC